MTQDTVKVRKVLSPQPQQTSTTQALNPEKPIVSQAPAWSADSMPIYPCASIGTSEGKMRLEVSITPNSDTMLTHYTWPDVIFKHRSLI